ncbi:protein DETOXIFICATION 45, chloroplastic [Vigna radiata var. radiata]|uniref:Protein DETOXIFICATION n=1 Tax=Vigna radiata var. radiata TaxID=3916 RepID=A0A1S3UEQ2_VIGRR|nr:protein DETOXIFICATION 45, chloroplastic [Vigna radiata var. radiata]XP_014504511.1 protein DETOXIFICATION 45, chloroplastic [Vigna radiata var. radiata]XP_014504512.1 protein DETOXIFICATION 45, chloroplastic [Vigna radiata var. radiata]XP_014504513.1 protein DETOXIFICATION 45, chloroplastic [Vigna radiata var. radiata]XP_014504515.1 protein DETOXIFICATION 45, chloroplastic [Vigna radiata var. radiata]XP_014504516.1 protein DETOXIFICATION 45, chloroplastic [Vigna radiata var. radiata]XP_01
MEATHFTSSSFVSQHHGSTRRRPFVFKRNLIFYGYCPRFLRQAQSFSSPLVTLRAKPYSLPPNHLTSEQQHQQNADEDHQLHPNPSVKLPLDQNEKLQDVDVKRELLLLSLPALAGQAIDPLSQLMETAYIGRLGTVELASAGVSVSIFNIISKLFNIPLLSVATSFVAEDMAKAASTQHSDSDQGATDNTGNGKPFKTVPQRKQLSSVSTALLLALGLGIFEALALSLGSGAFLNLIGVSTQNPTYAPARHFLSLRAVGAPAVVLSLALQGIFRGFKDTKTPVICLGIGNFSSVFLFPLLMYYFRLGVTGAAISTVISQYIGTILMIWCLNKRAELLPPRMGNLQFGSYIKSGGYLLGRTLAVLSTITLGTSMAARHGPVAMAAHQICMQVWLAVSLLTDALAASGQALIASSVSRHEYKVVKEITSFVLRIGLVMGICLTAILGASFGSLATIFTQDSEVLQVVRSLVLFVSVSQPFNALAYIFDGLHYGVSDFRYAAFSMMFVGAVSSAFLLFAPPLFGLQGVWLGLVLFMALRSVAGAVRCLSKNGPWWFLHRDLQIV